MAVGAADVMVLGNSLSWLYNHLTGLSDAWARQLRLFTHLLCTEAREVDVCFCVCVWLFVCVYVFVCLCLCLKDCEREKIVHFCGLSPFGICDGACVCEIVCE